MNQTVGGKRCTAGFSNDGRVEEIQSRCDHRSEKAYKRIMNIECMQTLNDESNSREQT